MSNDDIMNDTTAFKAGSVPHTCTLKKKPSIAGIQDVTDEMKACISSRAVQECTATAAELAGQVRMEFEQQYEGKPVVMLDIEQLQSAIYRSRNKEFSDWESQIRSFPLAFCDPTVSNPRLFFRFMLDVVMDGEIKKLVGWAHPSLLFLLRGGRAPLYIDGTFKVVPNGF